ncbi:MAG: hypothetical protein U9P44_04005, partial [archaeon]|nr:hypothetical protein [archaeon]
MNKMKVSFIFSTDIGTLKPQIEEVVKNTKKTISEKEKSFRVSVESIKKNELNLTLESEGFTHNYIARVKNFIIPLFSKNKIGIRAYKMLDYKLRIMLDSKPKEKFTIPMAKSIEFQNKTVILTFDSSFDQNLLSKGVIERIAGLVKDKVTAQYYEGKEEYNRILWTSEKKDWKYKKDPTEDLIKLKWIIHGPGQGQWFYTQPATAIFKAMEKIAIEKILRPLGFKEVISPKVVPFEVWEKTGHLSGSEPEIYFVSLPKSRDIKDWEDVIDHYKITKKAPIGKIKKMLKDPIGALFVMW